MGWRNVAMVAGVLVGAGAAEAQRSVQIDLRAGFNSANMAFEDLPGSRGRSGFMGGVSLGILANSWMAIQPELSLSQKGSDLDPLIGDFIGDPRYGGDLRMSYLETALLWRAGRHQGPGMRPSAFVGLSLGFEVACSVKVNFNSQSQTDPCGVVGFETATTDLGLVAGGRVEIPFSDSSTAAGGGLFFEVRYTHGATNVNALVPNGRPWYHRVFTFGVGARIS